MATRTTSTRARSTGTRSAAKNNGTKTTTTARKRAAAKTAQPTQGETLTREAQKVVRSVRTRASRAAKKVPTDRTSLSIAAGVIAGLVAAGVAIFMNRDRVREVINDGTDKLRKATDDLSRKAHDRIDGARDNIGKLRQRADASNGNGADTAAAMH
jgi:lipid-binding SYLF domain-containing protein